MHNPQHSGSEFGQFGQLTCTVQISPDTSSCVEWWTNGQTSFHIDGRCLGHDHREDMPTLTNLREYCPSSHSLTAKAMKLTEISYCEQWLVISNKHGFEVSALMVSGRDHTVFYHVRIDYIHARAD